jgi:hypothetical protein
MTTLGWDGLPCGDTATTVDPRSAATIGRQLLTAVEQVYLEAGIALPDRHLWTAGEVAWDCELVAVSLDSLRGDEQPNWNSPGVTPGISPCERPVVAVYRISVVRCVPVPSDGGKLPTPEQVALSADMTAIDAYLLQKSSCKLDFWGWDQDPPNQGGMQGVTLVLTGVVG